MTNSHNITTVNNIFNPSLVKVGNNTYGELNVISFANKSKLTIGNFVSIAQEVAFILDAEHYTDQLSTYISFSKRFFILQMKKRLEKEIYVLTMMYGLDIDQLLCQE